MKAKPLPRLERLNELLTYDAETGGLVWKMNRRNAKAGTQAGFLHANGYIMITIDYKQWRAHRIIWLMVYGSEPLFIDHADGNKTNNLLSNLRNCTRSENNANARKHVTSKSPYKGVMLDKSTGKWRSRVTVNGVRKALGSFLTAEDAAVAYRIAAQASFGPYARFSEIGD